MKSYWSLFISEVFNPFYLFQAFSIVLWSADEYYYYAACVLFLTAVSVVASLVQTKKASKLNTLDKNLHFPVINWTGTKYEFFL